MINTKGKENKGQRGRWKLKREGEKVYGVKVKGRKGKVEQKEIAD